MITVGAGAWDRFDKPVELTLGNTGLLPVRVIEVDDYGAVLDENVPVQCDRTADGAVSLTWLMTGITPAGTTRRYAIQPDDRPPTASSNGITLTDCVMHQGQESYRIVTANAMYVYHKLGAGFASLIDAEGNDWLSYRPYGGSDGRFRGIPNLAYPENYFHPGGTGCTSTVVSAGPLKITLRSASIDEKWACVWDIFPTYARLTVLEVDHPYWFLYEGTPGGVLDESGDYCVRSNGLRLPLTYCWEEPIPAPEWVYFGAANTPRVLFLVHHEADDHPDSFWPMEHNMTVFGFGRSGLESYMTRTPAQFTIGLADEGHFEAAQRVIDSAFRPLQIDKD